MTGSDDTIHAIGRLAHAGEITLDAEFRELLPRPAPDEQRHLEHALLAEGCCREPLIVWPCEGRLILLVGYPQFPLLRLYRLTFRVVEKPFFCREEARLFIIKHQLSQLNLTPLGVSYLRGLRYDGEKLPRGGDRKSAEARAGGRRKTAEALAEIFSVSVVTIHRDGAFAAAVNTLAANCGDDIKPLILSRGAKLTRGRVLALAELPPEVQREVMARLRQTGKMPRRWPGEDPPTTITLPLEPWAMTRAILRRLGPAALAEIAQAALAVLADAELAAATVPVAALESRTDSRNETLQQNY